MSKSIKDIWCDEFLTSEVGSNSKIHCGLCGNSGRIDTTGFGIKMSSGRALEPIKAFCICPNGRAIKRQVDANKRKELKDGQKTNKSS